MIRSVKDVHRVYSEKGKPLSRIYPTRQQADKRLNQIEYFKSKKK